MNKTLFSIIIPVYNTKISFLKDCFESIKQQSYTNYKVINIFKNLAPKLEKESKVFEVATNFIK